MNQGLLENKSVLVTGGATGIGREICTRLASEGAFVWINYRTNKEEAINLKSEIEGAGGQAMLAYGDICNPAQVESLLSEIAGDGGVHSMVYSVSAPLDDKRFSKTEWSDFLAHWQTAVQGAYLLVRALMLLKTAKRLESIVFILSSSVLGVPPSGKSAYVSAKYALLGLAKSLAVELAAKGVRVNCVSPGFTQTRLTANVDDRIQEMISRSVPLNRLCKPEDVAAAVTYLLSKDSSYLTGVNLPVCGGVQMD